MILVNKTKNTDVDVAISRGRLILEEILPDIRRFPTFFSHTKFTVSQVQAILREKFGDNKEVEVIFYKTFWPWSSAIGSFHKGKVRINRRKMPLSMEILTGLLYHEGLGHYAGFGHPFHNTADRPNSVPYYINRTIEKEYEKRFGKL